METVYTISKIKEEPCDDQKTSMFELYETPPQNLIEIFFDKDSKKHMDYCDYQANCLDEADGIFKCFRDLVSNQVKSPLVGDLKNCCTKCDQLFNNLLAAQNHFIFYHPCSSMLTKAVPCAINNINGPNETYNWLNEPMIMKVLKKQKESPNIIVIKNENDYHKKLGRRKKFLHLAEMQPYNRSFTLESIKARPQEGITVVKKSDIKFDQLKMQAESRMLYSKKPTLSYREAPPIKSTETIRHLIKIDINEALKQTSKSNAAEPFTNKFLELLVKSQETKTKYFCNTCNLEMFDLHVFDNHMKGHLNATFSCPYCRRTFYTHQTRIGNHLQTCKKDSINHGINIVCLPETN